MAVIKHLLRAVLLQTSLMAISMEDVERYADKLNRVSTQQEADLVLQDVPLCLREKVFNRLERMNHAVSSSFSGEDPRNGLVLHNLYIPEKIMLHIFCFLPIPDIGCCRQVCKKWLSLNLYTQVWNYIGQALQGDYRKQDTTQENIKRHYLRVLVNTMSDPDKISYLVYKYGLNKSYPLRHYQSLIDRLCIQAFSKEIIEERAAHGSKYAIRYKIEGLVHGQHGYKANCQKAYRYIEELAEVYNEEGIKNKILGLTYGHNGYERDPQAAMTYIEKLANEGNLLAIDMKIEGLRFGYYGYQKSEWVNRKYERGSSNSVRRKILGIHSDHRPPKHFRVDHKLYPKGEAFKQIERKIRDLAYESGIYGFKSYNLKEDLRELKTWLEEEAAKDARWAQYIIAQGMKYGLLGFRQDRHAANRYILRYGLSN